MPGQILLAGDDVEGESDLEAIELEPQEEKKDGSSEESEEEDGPAPPPLDCIFLLFFLWFLSNLISSPGLSRELGMPHYDSRAGPG